MSKTKPFVSVHMDVEDPIHPRSDDAALDLAMLFASAGVRASFCITGEKCRTLMARGRTDVLDALRPHALGLHTDTHSIHPTTMELLADLEWSDGCEAAWQAERRGFEAFCQAFGRPPSFWGGAGNTWSPEISDALKRLGIGAYVYALTEVPGSRIHRFNGVLGFPQTHSISELEWADDVRAGARSQEVLRSLADKPLGHSLIFVGHPTKFRHVRYWDEPYFGGRNPNVPEPADPLPLDAFQRSKRNLSSFLRRLAACSEILGIDEAIQMPRRFRRPTSEELEAFQRATADNLRQAAKWPVHREGLDPENIVRKTLALADTLEIDFGETPQETQA